MRPWCCAAALQLLATSLASGAEISFVREVAPILVDQCLECHRSGKSKGSYRLDTFELMQKAGDSEARPLVPGDPSRSEFLRLIAATDEEERMPKKGDPLSESQQSVIRKWIAEGARFDGKDVRAPLITLVPEKPRPRAPERYPRSLPVTALALSGDGRLLAVSGHHEVTLWDGRTGRLTARIGGMPEKVNALRWVGSSNLLAVAGGTPARSGEVWLVAVDKRAPVKRLVATGDSVLALAASPDGSRLAAAGADNHIRLFAMPEGRLLWDVEPHAEWVTTLAFSPDGKHLASGSRDRMARLFDPASGGIEITHTGHEAAVTNILFSRDGTEILSGDASGQVRRWGLDGSAKKDSTLRPSRQDVTGLAFFDDELAAATADGLIVTMDFKTRRVKDRLVRHQDRLNVLDVVLLSTGPLIASGSHDGEVRIYDARQQKEILKFIASPGFDAP